MDKFRLRDEALIAGFFAEHKEIIQDDGFTERVLSALPKREDVRMAMSLRLRRWSLWLNVLGIVVGIGLLISLGVVPQWWHSLQQAVDGFLANLYHFDFDSLLVRLMLFLHRLPEILPSPSQVLALLVTSVTLLLLSIKGTVGQRF